MREYTMKDLKPSPSQLNAINKHILAKRSQRTVIMRDNISNNERLLAMSSTSSWNKLTRQGKIIELAAREWAMEWDI